MNDQKLDVLSNKTGLRLRLRSASVMVDDSDRDWFVIRIRVNRDDLRAYFADEKLVNGSPQRAFTITNGAYTFCDAVLSTFNTSYEPGMILDEAVFFARKGAARPSDATPRA